MASYRQQLYPHHRKISWVLACSYMAVGTLISKWLCGTWGETGGSCVPSQLQFNRRRKSNMNIKLHSWDNLISKQKPAHPKELTSGLWVGRAAVLCLCPVTATAQRDRAMVEINRSQFAARAIPCIRPTGVVARRKEWAHAVRLVCTNVSSLSLLFFLHLLCWCFYLCLTPVFSIGLIQDITVPCVVLSMTSHEGWSVLERLLWLQSPRLYKTRVSEAHVLG